MEIGWLWTRRVGMRSMLLQIHPSMPSTSSSSSILSPHHNHHLSFLPLKNPPLNLPPLFSSPRRPLSSSAAALPLTEIDGTNAVPHKGAKVLLKGMTYSQLEKWVQSHGFRPGQALMLWKSLYGNNTWAHHVDELEGLNKDFKKMLHEHAELKAISLEEVRTASDGTSKILFRLDDELVIETVIIPCDRGRTTVCVSSQVGCAMNCQFCYTGRMGLKRHLTTAEIVDQVIFAQRLLAKEDGSVTNVVFMGMGEPLQNIDNVIKATDIMVHDQGLHYSPRRVTVSTSGLVPQLRRFLRESNCSVAVSLNATTDEVRNWIMPINRKYNLALLLQTLKEELQSKNNFKVLFEYVLLAGVNDSLEDAKRIIDLVQGIPCKINLIQFNPHKGSQFRPTTREKMIEFRNTLAAGKCLVFMRDSRGDDQMAACGQLGNPGEIQAPLLRVPQQFQTALNA
ncbi:Dual-specificity RNA methyltransferase RlmN [Euphorbia peplus]|nr:Dual-specificity RNA methyltransferase RlmN [Euphorbia peplus]